MAAGLELAPGVGRRGLDGASDRIERGAGLIRQGTPRLEGEIGAEELPGLARNRIAQVGGKSIDGHQRCDAGRHTAREQEEPPPAGARIAPRHAQDKRERHAALSLTISPSESCTVRRAWWARSWSCVTSTSVVPWATLRSRMSAMMVAPVAASRLPVGSSAKRILGVLTNARASATRCCS